MYDRKILFGKSILYHLLLHEHLLGFSELLNSLSCCDWVLVTSLPKQLSKEAHFDVNYLL